MPIDSDTELVQSGLINLEKSYFRSRCSVSHDMLKCQAWVQYYIDIFLLRGLVIDICTA